MPGDTGGLQHGISCLPHLLRMVGQVLDGGLRGGVLLGGFPRFLVDDSGGTAVPHHF